MLHFIEEGIKVEYYSLVCGVEVRVHRYDSLSKVKLIFHWIVPVIEPVGPFALLYYVVGGAASHFPPPITAILAQPVALQSCQEAGLDTNSILTQTHFFTTGL